MSSFVLVIKKNSKQATSFLYLVYQGYGLVIEQRSRAPFHGLFVLFVFSLNALKTSTYGLSCSGRTPVQHSKQTSSTGTNGYVCRLKTSVIILNQQTFINVFCVDQKVQNCACSLQLSGKQFSRQS